MAQTKEYWLQIENHTWDVCPWGVDRAASAPLVADPSGRFRAVSQEVLIIRRYSANWAAPADHPINPWDLAEPDAARTGGTLPGAVLEGKVADDFVVHFRNADQRAGVPAAERIHSLHAHGAQQSPLFVGAYPIAPPDPAQANKRSDRIAPGETFTYRWTCPQRAAAGAWLIHDGGPVGALTTGLGAFAVLLIRAPGEQLSDVPARALRQPGDTATHVAAVPSPPKRADYVLVFHELPGVGLCLNGRQALGNTPALIAGEGTRMTVRCLNATAAPVAVHIHGHRWEHAGDTTDVQLLPPGGGASLSLLSGSFEFGGGLGEWLITGQAGLAQVSGSLVVTSGGAVSLLSV